MNEALWTRVQSALDERRDPLADGEVRAWLLEHPDDALELGDLRAAIGAVERADNPLRASRRSRLVPMAAAAGFALLALGAWLATPQLTAAQELQLHPVVSAPELCRVESWAIVSTVESADGTITVRASDGRLQIEHRVSDDSSSVEGVVLSSESLVMR